MMRVVLLILCWVLLGSSLCGLLLASDTTVEKKSIQVRQPVDTVGYTHTAEGISKVVELSLEAEKEYIAKNREALGLGDEVLFAAAISPHDDYAYAQQAYAHVYPWLKAKTVVMIGVAHKARNFPESEGKLVFGEFDAWHGPYGDVPVSALRDELLGKLPEEDVFISNELQGVEHSLEGLIPFLQHFNRGVEIVPILVPYMSFDRLVELSEKTGGLLTDHMKEHGLALGKDVAILISSDCVHYGDQDWGGKSFAEFGTDGKGYDRAVARDMSFIDDYLVDEITIDDLRSFYHSVVAEDYHQYKVTWCGRFSIPFGLATLVQLKKGLVLNAPKGDLLRYGTTLDPGRVDADVPGLGVTAKANLHHWVGFTSIGYR